MQSLVGRGLFVDFALGSPMRGGCRGREGAGTLQGGRLSVPPRRENFAIECLKLSILAHSEPFLRVWVHTEFFPMYMAFWTFGGVSLSAYGIGFKWYFFLTLCMISLKLNDAMGTIHVDISQATTAVKLDKNWLGILCYMECLLALFDKYRRSRDSF